MFIKKVLPVAITFALAACGGGSETGDSSSPMRLLGDASKGLIINGNVNIYPFVNGSVATDPIGTGTTDSSGSYQIELDESYIGGPVQVVVTAGSTTVMKCDLPNGCDNGSGSVTLFGGEYSLNDSSLELKAMASPSEDDERVNVSTLTHIAAEVIEDRIAAQPDLNTSAINNTITFANAQIVNLFNLPAGTELTKLPIIDITDGNALNNASDDAIQAAALNAAIVEASANDNSNTSLESVLDTITTVFVIQGGGIVKNSSSDATTDLSDILNSAQNVIDAAKTEAAEDGVTLTNITIDQIKSALAVQEADSNTATVDEVATGEVSDTVLSDKLTQAKAAVEQVRTLGRVLLSSEAEAFKVQLEATELSSSKAADLTLNTLGAAVEEITAAIALKADNPEATVHSSVFGDIALNDTGTYTLIGTYTLVDYYGWGYYDEFSNWVQVEPEQLYDATLNLTITATLPDEAYTEGSPFYYWWNRGSGYGGVDGNGQLDTETEEWTTTGNFLLSVQGTVKVIAEGKTVTLTLNQGSSLTGSINDSWLATYEETVDSETLFEGSLSDQYKGVLSNLDLDLLAELSDGTTTFSGSLNVDISSLTFDNSVLQKVREQSDASQGYQQVYTWSENSTFAWKTASVNLSGEFSSSLGIFGATLNITSDGKGLVFGESDEEGYSYLCDADYTNCESSQYFSTEDQNINPETSTTYGDFGFTLSFDLDLPTVSNDATATITGTRTGLEAGELEATISYGGANRLDLTANGVSKSLTIINQDNVVISAKNNVTSTGDDYLSGNITIDDSSAGSFVEDADNGIILVRYFDGSGESIQ